MPATEVPPRWIKTADIKPSPASLIDPQGFLFEFEGEIHRCIRSASVPLFEKLLANGALEDFRTRFGLVAVRRTPLRLEEIPDAVIYAHPRVSPITYCVEWPASMLYAAARQTIDLATELADSNLMLQDAHPWNVLFEGTKPVFIDLTSIVPADAATIWPAEDQFRDTFLRPIAAMASGRGRAARALLADDLLGVDADSGRGLLPSRPMGALLGSLDRRLQKSQKAKQMVRDIAARAAIHATPAVRRRYFERLARQLERVRPSSSPGADPWTRYYAEIPEHVDRDAKLRAVTEVLERLRPKTLLDLGCNTGVFSLAAARALRCRTLSIDSSEPCVESLFATARKDALPITPLVANVARPTPSLGFLGRAYPPLVDRSRSDAVLCLGLMHHLHIAARLALSQIAELLHLLSARSLIFEFVGMDDENVPHLSQRRPIRYDLETVRSELGVWFPSIEVLHSDRPTRRLLVCEK